MKFSFALILTAICLASERVLTADAASCYECSSFLAPCGTTITDTSILQFNTAPCNGLCFTRTDSEGIIRRGCTSSFFFDPALSSAETSRTINGLLWCFCNTDNCNIPECSATATTDSTTTTATTTISRPTSLRCLECSSFNPNCGITVTSTVNIETVPCSSPNKCFTRLGADGIIRRGCSAGFFPPVTSQTTCEVKNGETWCYCEDASSCNTLECTAGCPAANQIALVQAFKVTAKTTTKSTTKSTTKGTTKTTTKFSTTKK